MLINTKFLGELEIAESDIITFKSGLPGFPEFKKFVILGLDGDMPIAMLQSVEETAINFVIAYPFAFNKDYAFDISEEDKEELELEEESEVLTYSIVTLKDHFADSTLNLLAPVVINSKKKLGKQIVLNDNDAYPIRYPIGALTGSEK